MLSGARNSLSKQAQFSFAADLFMLQAILKLEEFGNGPQQLEYTFPRNCFLQVIGWLLDNPAQIGVSEFRDVIHEYTSADEVMVKFPSEREQDKLHQFFESFNQKRRQAQGIDQSFPPLPDIYQGQKTPEAHVIHRYMHQIREAFDGDSRVVEIPIGPNGAEFTFRCG